MADLTPMTLGGVRCLTRSGGVRGGVFTCVLTVTSEAEGSGSGSLKAGGAGRISEGWTAGAVKTSDGVTAAGGWTGTEAGGGLWTRV